MAVVTDSAASLPKDEAERLGIAVVPMSVMLGDEAHDDDALDADQVIGLLAAGPSRVRTSAPSPGAYLDALRNVEGRPVLVATVSRQMSASYDAASTAASYLRDTPIVVLDTATAAGGQGLVVLAAARAARAGATLEEAEAAARAATAKVRLVAVLDQLDQLVHGGRLPPVAARAGRTLGVHPVFEFRHGAIRARRPARSLRTGLSRVIAACRAGAGPGRTLHAAVLEAGAPGAATLVEVALKDDGPSVTVDLYRAPFSPVMVAHTGPGLVGLAWWWETAPVPAPAGGR